MIHGFHIVISAYGFWLPNDPRGSWSDFVRRWELLRFGKATQVGTRQSVANRSHDAARRHTAKSALQRMPVCFNGEQARAVAQGFGVAASEGVYAIHACSILPEHAHLVIGRHVRDVRQIIGHLKARASRQLTLRRLHPFAGAYDDRGTLPSPWARGSWVVYLDSDTAMRRAIAYVQDNPVKEGKRRQTWSFVTPYAAM